MKTKAMKKNDLLQVEITDLGNDGEGIGRADGYTLFVKDALIGDTVLARILKDKKTYAYAKVEEIVTPSKDRVQPPCPVSRQCGGCQLQALSYQRELQFKENKVRNNLLRIGGFSKECLDQVFEPIVGADEGLDYRYRNKAQYPIGNDKNGNPVAGFYAGRTHSIIPCTDCLLGQSENQLVLEAVLSYMRECHVKAYDEETGKGLVRHVLIRISRENHGILVCIIVNGDNLPKEDILIGKLANIPNMTSVSVNVNKEKTNVIMGSVTRTIWGSDTISDCIRIYEDNLKDFSGKSVSFRISPRSFYQVNPYQTEKLYSLALSYANLSGSESVWDLYCGIGTISLFLAGSAGNVYGVEIVPQAIEDARRNAEENGITNATFLVGKAEEVLPAFYHEPLSKESNLLKEEMLPKKDGFQNISKEELAQMQHPDVIVVDPPRKGCDEACLNTMLKMQPDRIVYVSCDSASLARDLKILCEGGYELRRVRPVDQFCHTVHVETVVLMTRTK